MSLIYVNSVNDVVKNCKNEIC